MVDFKNPFGILRAVIQERAKFNPTSVRIFVDGREGYGLWTPMSLICQDHGANAKYRRVGRDSRINRKRRD